MRAQARERFLARETFSRGGRGVTRRVPLRFLSLDIRELQRHRHARRAFVSARLRVRRRASALADAYSVVCGSEKGWIVEVRVTREALRAAVRDGVLLSEEKYAEVCDAQERVDDAAASRAYP